MNLVDRILKEAGGGRKMVVVVGDVMVDRWVHGRAEQCQDGCLKFVQSSTLDTPGGAANAARSLSHWGAHVEVCGYGLDDCPVKMRCVDELGTSKKIIYRIDDDGENRSGRYQWSRDLALELVNHADAVLMSDYDKGYLTADFICEVSSLCSRRGVPCVADCKRPPDTYVGCVLKCNNDYLHRYSRELMERVVCGAGVGRHLVVTAGRTNPIVWDGAVPTGLGYDLPTVKCANHVGAGDCFVAHLVLAMACGCSLKEAAALAHSAGRVYVQHPHNRAPRPAEVAADLALATSS